MPKKRTPTVGPCLLTFCGSESHDDWSVLCLIAPWDGLGMISLLSLAATKLRRTLGQKDPIVHLDTTLS